MMKTLPPMLTVPLLAFALSACSSATPPADNGNVWSAKASTTAGDALVSPLAARAVKIGSEGATLPACPSVSRVKAGGTDVYWAPDETRVVKEKLAGGADVALCEATGDDKWFGVVFVPAVDAGADAINSCNVQRTVRTPREYQGPCRWGWIRGGTVELGNRTGR